MTTRRQFLKGTAAGAADLSLTGLGRHAFAGTEDVIRIGWVNARSGPLSPFADADDYVLKLAQTALASGVNIGGKTYGVKFILKDTQSSPPRASQVTKDLISSDNVHLVITSSTPETVNPVADTCEAAAVPCVSTVAPWESIYFGRGAKPGQRAQDRSFHRAQAADQHHEQHVGLRLFPLSERLIACPSTVAPHADRHLESA